VSLRVGVDGCRAGWLAFSFDADGTGQHGVYRSIAELAQAMGEANILLIDMPIGLPSVQRRACDSEARRLLGRNRASSIFPVPCREALAASDYRHACDLNAAQLGVKLSKQSWNILPKIRELDVWLQATGERRWRECHPELAFRALNNRKVMAHGKKTTEGLKDRLDLLQRLLPTAETVYAAARRDYRKSQVADDDLVDALALAVTARISGESLNRVPRVLEYDSTSLPMEIVFASDQSL